MEQPKEQNYLHGAAILTAGVVIMKILGAIYKIPLGNILGDDGYAYFYSTYSVYNLFLTLATAGLPVALSRMIAEANTQGRPMQIRRTFSVAWWTFTVVGVVCAAVMFEFPQELANLLSRPEAAQGIYAISPAILFVCVVSAYRGYCQGMKNMTPTTVGQVLEVLVKVIVGLGLAILFGRKGNGPETSSAGAVLGVSAGGLAALIFMVTYKKRRYPDKPAADPDAPDSRGSIFKNLLRIGIPITIGASGLSLMGLIDTAIINGRLQNAAGLAEQSAALFGVFGKAQTIYNLPPAFVMPLVISTVPSIAACMTRRDTKGAGKIAEDALRITLVVGLPMGIGLAVLAHPVMKVLYPGSNAAGPLLLTMMGAASVFVCFSLVQNAVLQAHGDEKLTIISIFAGGIIKVLTDWFLVGIPELNIYGAPIGTFLCYLVMCAVNQAFINGRYEKDSRPRLSNIVPKPLFSSLVMGAAAWLAYEGLAKVLGGADMGRLKMALAMLAAIAVGVVVYIIAAVATGAVTYEDMALIPKGDRIARALHIRPAPKHQR
ncbi:MAG TPA: polysaccharide biosynthesis protein [Oscillospiraceae bacterium]|nr:polysaccharide biosynthesis protein [Oscillospiraceae bacterium]